MNSVLAVLGSTFVFLAALIHILIFVMESVLWHKTRVQKIFGIRSADAAAIIKPWVYNQGFYNAFLTHGACCSNPGNSAAAGHHLSRAGINHFLTEPESR